MSTVPFTIQLPVGPQGLQGQQGPAGPQGIQGPPGPPGIAAAAIQGPPIIPVSAKSYGVLDNIANAQVPWNGKHDDATPGTVTNTVTAYINAVSGRNFSFSYTAQAGCRFSLGLATDLTYPQHFCYESEIMFGDPSQILNMELDCNQVLADGRTCIMDCQCASVSGTFEFDGWKPTRIVGNPQQWDGGFHRIRIFWHRSADGNTVTFDGVEKDGVWMASGMQSSTRTVALNWKPLGLLMINFQIEGSSKTSGNVQANVRNMQVWSW